MKEPFLKPADFRKPPTPEKLEILRKVKQLVKEKKSFEEIAKAIGIDRNKNDTSTADKVIIKNILKLANRILDENGNLIVDYRGENKKSELGSRDNPETPSHLIKRRTKMARQRAAMLARRQARLNQ